MAPQRSQITGLKGLVLDANILVRAVFGLRVLQILEKYEDTARFHGPDVCIRDALKHVPLICRERGWDRILVSTCCGRSAALLNKSIEYTMSTTRPRPASASK